MATADGKAAETGAQLKDVPQGVSALLAKILDQLSLSAWLPALLLVSSVTVLLKLQDQTERDFTAAIKALTDEPLALALLALPAVILATLVTQAFSFESIRLLEGYWGGLLGPARSLLTRIQVFRMRRTIRSFNDLHRSLFMAARLTMIERDFPRPVIDALEADVLHKERPQLTPEQERQADRFDWRSLLPAWHRGRLERLELRVGDFPTASRVLPTRLGNVLRSTEDTLRHDGADIESFAYTWREQAPERIQIQHDQFRTRLDMYCTLTLVSALLAVTSPAMLARSPYWGAPATATTVGFFALTVTSYCAAIASARGYCSVLKHLNGLAKGVATKTLPSVPRT